MRHGRRTADTRYSPCDAAPPETPVTDLETAPRARVPLPRPGHVAVALGLGFVLAGGVFVLAHRFGWTVGWIYVSWMIGGLVLNLVCLLTWNPALIARRAWPGPGTKRWDVVWSVASTPVWIALFVVAALELRAGPPRVPGPLWLLGIALLIPGWAIILSSMVVNPFFEKTVRIQTERGHRVIDTGPYARVRHPGYVGFAAWLLATPLLLACRWAWIPAALGVASLWIRTVLEDRTLRAELAGYDAYATRVRFRWIPGVW